MALHVGGGVGLGVPQLLGLPEGVPKGRPLLEHLGKDIIGGAVQNTGNFGDVVGGKAFPQGLKDGDAPAHAGLKEEVDPLLLGQGQQLRPLFRHQLLVGGDDAFPRQQRFPHPGEGGLHPAQGLQHHRHLRVLPDKGKILGEPLGIGQAREGPAIQHPGGLHRLPRLAGQELLVFCKDLHHPGAHHAVAQ